MSGERRFEDGSCFPRPFSDLHVEIVNYLKNGGEPRDDAERAMQAELDRCPDCGRKKAHSVQDVMYGYCEKWYAIRDPEARVECDAIKAFMRRRANEVQHEN